MQLVVDLVAVADGQDLLDGSFADQLVVAFVVDDHRHAATLEVEGDLVDLAAGALHVEVGAGQDGAVEEVAEARLVMGVHPGVAEDVLGLAADDVDVALEHDVVLRERAGLVGAEDVHRPEVLDGVETLHHDLQADEGFGALGKASREDHREHLGREADRDGEGEEERVEGLARAPGAEAEGQGGHHQHHPDHHPDEAAGPEFEGRRVLAFDHAGAHRAELRVTAGGEDEGAAGAALDVAAHQAAVGAFLRRMVRLQGRQRHAFDRHRFARQRGLGEEEVLGLDHAAIRRDDRARGEDDDVAGHDLVDWHAGLDAVADDEAGGLHHRLQLGDDLRRAALLEVGQEDGKEDHAADQGGAEDLLRLVVLEEVGQHADHHQLDDQRFLELAHQLDEGAGASGGDGVRTELLETARSLRGAQALAAGFDGGEGRVFRSMQQRRDLVRHFLGWLGFGHDEREPRLNLGIRDASRFRPATVTKP